MAAYFRIKQLGHPRELFLGHRLHSVEDAIEDRPQRLCLDPLNAVLKLTGTHGVTQLGERLQNRRIRRRVVDLKYILALTD